MSRNIRIEENVFNLLWNDEGITELVLCKSDDMNLKENDFLCLQEYKGVVTGREIHGFVKSVLEIEKKLVIELMDKERSFVDF